MTTTQAALKAARECIEQDRAALMDCHQSPRTGAVEDAAGLAGLAEYDAVLAKIDAAFRAADAAQPEPVAWQGLTEGERNQTVQSICEYGTGFVAPLFAVVEGVERTLERRNAAPQPPAPEDATSSFDREHVIDLFEMYDKATDDGVWDEHAVSAARQIIAALQGALADHGAPIAAQAGDQRLSVHLSHCNFGENAGSCKYGDEDCPALTEEWQWFGNALQRAERPRKQALAAQAGPAQAPLTRQQIDEVMTEHYPLSSLLREEVDAFEACVRDIERRLGIGALVPLTDEQIADAATSVKPYPIELVQVPAAQLVAFTRAVEQRLGIGARAPASTRPADASISGQRVDMAGWKLVPMEPSAEFIKRVENSGVWRENEVRNLYADIIAAAPQAPAEQQTRSQKLAAAGFTRRPSLWAMEAREALELIATPKRPDGTWNRDREACRRLAAEALGRYEDEPVAPAEQQCACGDRLASQCPGQWEPGCDLGANEKHAKVAPAEPAAQAVDAETRRLAQVALDESSGAALVCDWMEAALKVCKAVVATPAAREAGTTAEG